MAGFRAYFENVASLTEEANFELSADESRHLCGALRAKVGDEVDVFDLSANVAKCKIVNSDSRAAGLCVLKKSRALRANSEIILVQGLPKGKTFDDIIAICVQLGVTKICPVFSEHCVVKLDAKERAKKLAKWRQQVVEAVKQSANLAALCVAEPVDFDEFIKRESQNLDVKNIAKFIASLDAENPPSLLSALKAKANSATGACILVGCEGDFSKSEYQTAYAAGFSPVTLGQNVLKSDIAAAYCASVCAAFFADK